MHACLCVMLPYKKATLQFYAHEDGKWDNDGAAYRQIGTEVVVARVGENISGRFTGSG